MNDVWPIQLNDYLELLHAFLVNIVGFYGVCGVVDGLVQGISQVHQLLIELVQFVFDILCHSLII